MALDKGNANCTFGLSKRIYDNWVADGRNGFVNPLTAAAQDIIRSLCWAVAQAVVDEIQGNAEVEVTVFTSNSGLQRTPNPNNPNTDTQGPSVNKTLAGAVL